MDEEVSPVDVTSNAELVGITFHTPSALHAYDLAAQIRKRGVCVALGGPHVTLVPDEAQDHADVISSGEAELNWPQILKDFVTGRTRNAIARTRHRRWTQRRRRERPVPPA